MRRCWACWDNAPQSGQVQETGKGAPSRSLFRRGQTIPKDAYPARSAHRVWNRFRQGRERHGGTARWAADRHRLVPASGGGKAAAEYPGCAAQGPAGKTGNSDSGRAAASDPAGGLRQHLCAAGGGEAPAAGTYGPGECQAHRNAGTEHRCAGRVLRCGAGRERRSGCGRGPSGYVSGGVRPSGGFRRGGVSPGRGRGGVSPASCGHRAPAGLPDRDRQQRRLAGSARSSIPDGRDRADSRGRSDSGDCGNRIPGRGGGVYPGLRPLLRPEPAGQRVPGTGPAGL